MIQPKIVHHEALAMYHAGAKDHEIAARFGVIPCSARQWRCRHGLPTKHSKRHDKIKHRKARRMLMEGASKRQVAEATGMNPRTVQVIRQQMPQEGLRRSGLSGRAIRNAGVNDNDLYPRILRAIGAGLPRDIKHDAANEMYVDILSGKLSADLVEARAARYRNWAWSMNGSNYGPASLDAANDDGFSLGDTIEDASALDDMDAVAERAWGSRSRVLETL